jgi:hypothetical protein
VRKQSLHFSPANNLIVLIGLYWWREKNRETSPAEKPVPAERHCTKLKCVCKQLQTNEIFVEAAGAELSSVLRTRRLLILGTATRAKKAPLPDPLYVYCTKILSLWSSADTTHWPQYPIDSSGWIEKNKPLPPIPQAIDLALRNYARLPSRNFRVARYPGADDPVLLAIAGVLTPVLAMHTQTRSGVTSRIVGKQELIIDRAREWSCENRASISPQLFLPGIIGRAIRDRREGKTGREARRRTRLRRILLYEIKMCL